MTVDENSPTEALWLEELGKGYHVFVTSYVLASFCKHVEVMFGVILKSCLGNVWNPFENLTSHCESLEIMLRSLRHHVWFTLGLTLKSC